MGLVTNLLGGGVTSQLSKAIKGRKSKSGAAQTPAEAGATGDSYARGGKVRKTGLAKLHKGERVLTKVQAKRYRKTGHK
jgi:hypothetical protein